VKAKTPGYAEFLPADRGRARQQMQALRLGDFIGVRYDIKSHAAPFEIYNLAADPQQRHDLGGNTEFAAMQREMHDTVLRVRRPDASAPRPYDAELVPALRVEKIAPGVEWRAYEIAAPWVAKLDAMPPAARGVQAAPDLSHTPPGRDFAMLSPASLRRRKTANTPFPSRRTPARCCAFTRPRCSNATRPFPKSAKPAEPSVCKRAGILSASTTATAAPTIRPSR